MLCPNNYAQIIADVAASLLADDQLGAERQLSEIAYERVPATKRRSVPRALIVRVYRRDCWTCRYCGQQTIFYPVMPLLGNIFGEQFPFNTYFKAGETHPAVVALSSTVDHMVPVRAGGDWRAESNLMTACWPCNARKRDLTLEQLHWSLRPAEPSAWDGLASSYRRLWEIGGKPTNEAHPAWLRALDEKAGPSRQL